MRRAATAVILLAALAAGAPAPAAEPAGYRAVQAHDVRIYRAVSPAVVGITCRTPRSGYYGTGVVVTADGYVLTATTVVPPGARDIRVFFPGAMEKRAKIAGTDAATESTLLKVAAKNLKFVPLADSARARPGQMAYTLGNPRGTLSVDDKVSFSSGFVSGVYKLVETGDFQSKYKDLVIETEAAVNPGSDGGPLVDGQGRLLGIISLGYSERRWLGVAVPVHLIAPRFEELKKVRPAAEHILPPEPVRRREAAWRAAVAGAAPAVVQVLVEREKKPPPKPGNLTFLQMREAAKKRYKMRPAGPASGLLVSARGHVLTAYYHLAEDRDEKGKIIDRARLETLKVRLADGRTLAARKLGFDRSLDLVMLKVEAKAPLPHAELADLGAAELPVGSALAVLGRSEDPGRVTVNRGRVSARLRGRRGAVQTSAFVNYGNTGGPAVNIRGQVVGVTGRLTPRSNWGQNSGIGFVTTAGTIRKIFADLAAGKEVKPPPRTLLGVRMGRGEPGVLGAPVGAVLPGSAAHRAGVRAGDIVTRIAGAPVRSWPDLVRAIRGRRPGEVVNLVVERGGRSLELTATLGTGR